MSLNNISFILHKPQLSENIGACARAMKNFNFSKLLLINPKPNFPNDKILATSVGAKDIVKKAKVFNSLEESLSKIDILVATSARYRNKNIKVEVSDKLVTITKDDMLMKAETYNNYNDAEEAYKEVCKQVDEYIKKKEL